MNLSDRQKQLIIAVIQEFMKTADAVSSDELKNQYKFDYSPATIRNELADLADAGYLYKEHSSAGRIPTTLAWKYYISDVMNEINVDPMYELSLRETAFKYRFSLDRLLKETLENLANKSKYTSIALVETLYKHEDHSPVYISGSSNILNFKEFQDLDLLRKVLVLIENSTILKNIFNKSKIEDDVSVLIGEEFGMDTLRHLAMVFTKFKLGKNERVTIAILGPARMDYAKSIPLLRAAMKNIKEATVGW